MRAPRPAGRRARPVPEVPDVPAARDGLRMPARGRRTTELLAVGWLTTGLLAGCSAPPPAPPTTTTPPPAPGDSTGPTAGALPAVWVGASDTLRSEIYAHIAATCG